MSITEYLDSEAFKKEVKRASTNAKFNTPKKIESDIGIIASEAFNEGIMSIIKFKNVSKDVGDIEKSKELTQMLPDNFIKGEMGLQAINGLLQAVISNQEDGVLNIGYESILRAEIENYIRIIYAIGVTSGFEIADDQNYRNLYLVNKQRFIMHGAETKKDKKTKKAKE